MKIINRYVLREHFGPFVFALSALTSLLLLQYIARKFGDLVGRGLSWGVIAEFMLLSIPFTLAMTLPMAMLVAVLYAFSRLASENEITAFKAGGVSTRSLLIPSVAAATALAVFMVWFNDQVLPTANHELQTLQTAIMQTKPTFALRPQVINTVKESGLYLRAGQIDEATGLMRDVTIYDVSDGRQRRTIYADSGLLALTPNHRDLSLRLFKGWMLQTPTGQHGQLDRIYYRESVRKIADVAKEFQSINADTVSKGEREMSVCEMEAQYEQANLAVAHARADSLIAAWRMRQAGSPNQSPLPAFEPPPKPEGIGALYCAMVHRYFRVKELHAEEVPRGAAQDTTHRDTTHRDTTHRGTTHQDTTSRDSTRRPVPDTTRKPAAAVPPAAPVPGPQLPARGAMPAGAAPAGAAPAGIAPRGIAPVSVTPAQAAALGPNALPPSAGVGSSVELLDAHVRLEDARYRRNRADVEIQKKFSLAFACIVFVLVGAPLALRFPRGGVGLVIGASFLIFAIYYVGLIGGESLANKNIISPFWAMWADNVIFLLAGIVLLTRMGKEGVTGRGGGGLAELFSGLFKRS